MIKKLLRFPARFLLIFGLGLSLSAPLLAAEAPPASALKREYESLRATVVTMRAVYLKAVGDVRSKAVLTEVDSRFSEAEDLAASREYDMAVLIMGEGNRALSKAISQENIAHPKESSSLQSGSAALETHKRSAPAKTGFTEADVAERRAELVALIDAARRIIAEKKTAQPALEQAENLRKEADALTREGNFVEGHKRLDLAYLLMRSMVRNMRDGEQLLAEKKFATPADEFLYEQRRNDEYLNLIGLLPANLKKASWPEILETALKLRQSAEAAALQGDFPGAIKTIEESTTAYIRVVRDAGLPI